MSVPKNKGRALIKIAVIVVVLVAAAAWASRGLRDTARVKPASREDAVDAVTGSVTVFADGGYKEIKSEAGGKVSAAQAINKKTPFTKNAPLVQLDTTDLDREISETEREFKSKQERWAIELENKDAEKFAADDLATVTRLYELGTASELQK